MYRSSRESHTLMTSSELVLQTLVRMSPIKKDVGQRTCHLKELGGGCTPTSKSFVLSGSGTFRKQYTVYVLFGYRMVTVNMGAF